MISTSFKHEGLAVVSKHGGIVAKINLKLKVDTFEYLCCCVPLEGASTIIVAIYRPGSQAATTSFFAEISTLFVLLVTYSLPVIVTGDVNIHFEDQRTVTV